MMWNVLNLVLGLVLLMYCHKLLQTVESTEFDKTDRIVGRVGGVVSFNFTFSDIRDEYNKRSSVLYGKRIIQDEIQIQDLRKESVIKYNNKTDSTKEYTVFENGFITDLVGNRTEIHMTNVAFVVTKTNLQIENGIYWIEFRSIPLRQKALVITGKPTIKEGSPPNPVLKPEDNYTSTIQLECHSVSTSIGDYQLPMYTVWYTNGMRMTDDDPTLTQINVTVDYNGGNFTCLATEYLPCYQRLQTTKDYNVLNIEECNNVFESETFIVQPEYPTIDLLLEPDQREIIVNKNEDLEVRCTAKCHPQCHVTWTKEFQILRSTGSIFITENIHGKELKIVNISSSHEGFYFCLVNNIHGESKKNFTLSVTETEDKAVNSEYYMKVVIGAVVAVAVAIVVVVIKCCKNLTHSCNSCPIGGYTLMLRP